MKQEKWITETTEVVIPMKLPLSCEERPFSRSLCNFFIHLFILTVTAKILLLAVKWPKLLVLAVMPIPPPPPPHLGPLVQKALFLFLFFQQSGFALHSHAATLPGKKPALYMNSDSRYFYWCELAMKCRALIFKSSRFPFKRT